MLVTERNRPSARLRTLVALAVLWAAAPASGAGGPPPPPPTRNMLDNLVDPNAEPDATPAAAPVVDMARMDQGRQTYKSYCVRCHGIDMVSPGGAFFDLRTFPLNDKSRFFDSVTHGKRAMPAWGGVFKPDDIEAIWSYVAGTQLEKQAQAK
jgi:mono/diheme cytochrome c family protein